MLLSLRYTSVVSLFGLLFALNSCKHCLGEGVDVPGLILRLHHILCIWIVILYRPSLAGAGVGVETALALPKNDLREIVSQVSPFAAQYWAIKELTLPLMSEA